MFEKVPQINWLPQQRPLSDLKTNIRLYIPTHMSIKAKYEVEIGRARFEIIGRICPCLHFFIKVQKISKRFSGVTLLIITVFAHDVATFNMRTVAHLIITAGVLNSVEFRIIAYYDPCWLQHAGSQGIDPSCHVPISAFCYVITIHRCYRQTDRQTDGRTDVMLAAQHVAIERTRCMAP